MAPRGDRLHGAAVSSSTAWAEIASACVDTPCVRAETHSDRIWASEQQGFGDAIFPSAMRERFLR